AILPQGEAVGEARCHSNYSIEVAGNRLGWRKALSAPGNHRSVALERQAVIASSRNGNHIGETHWGQRLAKFVITPSLDSAIGLKRQAMQPSGRHSNYAS